MCTGTGTPYKDTEYSSTTQNTQRATRKQEIATRSMDPKETETARNPHRRGLPPPAAATHLQIRGSPIAQTL